MKIVKLEAENVKRLKAVEITPDPNSSLVVIKGKNAQGKTSVLDAIAWAIGGKRLTTEKPVREGALSACSVVDLGDLVVERDWQPSGKSTLKVTGADGLRLPSPQAVLDALLGEISFDPLAFARMSPKEQVITLIDAFDVDIDLDKLETKRQNLFEGRTAVGRDVKRLNGLFDSLPDLPDDLPNGEVCLTSLMKKLESAHDVRRQMDFLKDTIDHESASIDQAKLELAERENALKKAKSDLGKLKAPDIDKLEAEIENAESINDLARQKENHKRIAADLAASRKEYDKFTRKIKKNDDAKSTALSSAKIYPGLSLDETGVTFNDVPFDQASSAEQLRVSLAIAMAANPDLRVIRISDGSLLDDDNLKLIEEMANEADYQVWIERVGEDGDVGIIIEDGSVKRKKSKPKRRSTKPARVPSKADVEF